MEKAELIKLVQNGMEIYATSYETEKDIAKNLDIEMSEVRYVGRYDGSNFEYNDMEFLDGDMIHVIERG